MNSFKHDLELKIEKLRILKKENLWVIAPLLLLGLISIPILLRSVKLIPIGHVGILEDSGISTPKILNPGLRLISPLSQISLVSTRIQDLKEKIETPSLEGLKYDIEVSLQYRLAPGKVIDVYEKLGTDNDSIVISRFRSLVREVTATYELQDAISLKRREMAARLKERLQESLSPLGFIVDEVLLREIFLPENIQKTIDEKIRVQQESEQVTFQVEKARQEAEIQKIQAQGEAIAQVIKAKAESESQRLLSSSLTPAILKLKSIEAAEKIGTSSNAKVYVGLGSSKASEIAPLLDQVFESRQPQAIEQK